MKRLAMLLFLLVPVLALPAAQAADGWYASLHLGKGWKEDADMHFKATSDYLTPAGAPWFTIEQNFSAGLSYSSGWGGGLSLGRGFGNWRAEGELFWRKSRVGGFSLTDFEYATLPTGSLPVPPIENVPDLEDMQQIVNEDTVKLSGKASLLTTALNLYYDLPVRWPLKPYVGAGLGAVHADKTKKVVMTIPPQCSVAEPCVGGDKHKRSWDFKWQLMAGARYSVADAWDVTLGWRYANLSNLKFRLLEGESELGFFGEDPLQIKMGSMHNIELGVVRRF